MRLLAGLFLSALAMVGQQNVAAEIDRIANSWSTGKGFMGTVLAARADRVVLEKGYGFANLEWDVPNVPAARFRLGSITKQFTATAVLQLVAAGKLQIDDPISTYLPETPDAWKNVRIHHLLNHTSGIVSYTGLPEFSTPRLRRVPLTPLEIVMLSKDKPLEFQPGEGYKYNNTGYVLLGYIIEKVSGQKYDAYVKEHIFQPLNMKDSGYDWTRPLSLKRASGYGYNPQTKEFQNADFLDMSLPHAAGSLYSTAHDLYLWDRALNAGKVLNKELLTKMLTPGRSNYGYGWVIDKSEYGTRYGHGGGINGFSTMIFRYPDKDAVVIVLSNVENGDAAGLARHVSDALFGKKVELPWDRKEATVDSKILERYVGSYQLEPLKITLTLENGRLMLQATGQPKVAVYASSDTTFFLKVVEATFEMSPDGQTMTFQQNGRTLQGKRVP